MWAREGRNLRLNNTCFAEVDPGVFVASMVCQKGYGAAMRPRIRYGAVASCLRAVGDFAEEKGASVHMPRIGCGQAGGRWEIVEELVFQHLVRRGLNVFVYDLPEAVADQRAQGAFRFGQARSK
jgi:hypothetical protein